MIYILYITINTDTTHNTSTNKSLQYHSTVMSKQLTTIRFKSMSQISKAVKPINEVQTVPPLFFSFFFNESTFTNIMEATPKIKKTLNKECSDLHNDTFLTQVY